MSEISTQKLSATHSLFLGAFRKIIKPMVKLFLANGITYTLLLEELKRVFIEVAEEDFRLGVKPQTDSRITLITGVHRKDVHRIRHEALDEAVPKKTNFSAQIIAEWVGNPAFLTPSGQPKKLLRLSSDGNEASFDALVANVSKDIRARSVFDEWLRVGIVTLEPDGYVALNTEAFIPEEDMEEKLGFLGMNVHDHLAAAVNNTLNQQRMFERCVYYDHLTLDQIEQLHQMTHEHGMAYLKLMNQFAMSAASAQQTTTQEETDTFATRYRFNTGVYFYFEKAPEHHSTLLQGSATPSDS